MTTIAFYFDFPSPYGYIAAERIEALAQRTGATLDWRAFNMRSVNANILGVQKPLFQAPLKGEFYARDVPRTIAYHGLAYDPGAIMAFNSVPALRAFWFLKDKDPALAAAFAKAVYRAFFTRRMEPSTPEQVAAIAGDLGADAGDMLEWLAGEPAKARLKAETEAAVAAGIWGTSSFRVGEELFWGCDRMDMLEDWITRGGWAYQPR
jgi:2-hydroxychromene-2-carboxylate isomerase